MHIWEKILSDLSWCFLEQVSSYSYLVHENDKDRPNPREISNDVWNDPSNIER